MHISEAKKHLNANEYLSDDDRRHILQWLNGRDLTKEKWKDIPGYDGDYQVSNLGMVRSWKSGNGIGFSDTPKIMRQCLDSNKYLVVNLTSMGDQKVHRVHRLVAKSFVPNPDNKRCVNHKLGIKTFNWAVNYEWCTSSENNQHAYDNQLKIAKGGEDSHNAKLTNDDVLEIVELRQDTDKTYNQIGELFGVHDSVISDIMNGKLWSHITGIQKSSSDQRKKLSKNDVLDIVTAYNLGCFSQREIADGFNVTKTTINRILTGKSWCSVTGIEQGQL